jgi:hypothetical protein
MSSSMILIHILRVSFGSFQKHWRLSSVSADRPRSLLEPASEIWNAPNVPNVQRERSARHDPRSANGKSNSMLLLIKIN